MALEDIGFYTLTDERARKPLTVGRQLERCELLLTARCNFRCPYCRSVGGMDLPYETALKVVTDWCRDGGLRHLRLSGGEPTLWKGLADLVRAARREGARTLERIAVSTNGSADLALYRELVAAGVNDFSVSLDACCAEDGDRMAGRPGAWDRVAANLPEIATMCYTTVGVVLTEGNEETVERIVALAHDAGVADVRLITAAQRSDRLARAEIGADLLSRHPILAWRVARMRSGLPVRGIGAGDTHHCPLVLDDIAAMGGEHYPCIIYLREGGAAIGTLGDAAEVSEQRFAWFRQHDTHADPICSRNCLDVCVAYNNEATARKD